MERSSVWHSEITDGAHVVDPTLRLEQALDLAYRYLTRRDRTVAEVRAHLEHKGADPAAGDGAIAELLELGYLDDARYAHRFAEDRRTLDGWGPDRIERKLQTLGLDASLIADALAARDTADELAAAVEMLQRRFREPSDDPRDRERALGMLVRKGYDLELAHDAIRAFVRI